MDINSNPAVETPTQAESSTSSLARLVLSFLGPPQVLVNGEAVIGPESQKMLALLAYLAVEAHRPHLRSVLVALFWPDQPEKQAYQDLRQIVSRLRRVIRDQEADPPHLITESQTIQFNLQSDCWLDVTAFRTLLDSTQHHRHRRLEACSTCVSQLARAAQLYRGDFLTDLHVPDSLAFHEWLLIERELLGQQTCAALHALVSLHLARGEPQTARQYARQLLKLDPWNEAARRVLFRTLALSDGRSAALQYYHTFRRALADELGVEPEDETRALIEQIRAGALADMQLRASRNSLPTPATLFVGREAEREQLSDYLNSQDQRLITLCGPGGSGKTRLALEIAAEQAPLWHDGVWFVPLAEVPDAEHLVAALVAALDLHVANRPPEPTDLIDFLRAKELLLILDGFEHLVDGGSLLQEILRWAPEVRILATSRARLGLRGEWAVQLNGLEMPPAIPATAAEAEDYSAMKLFLQNARYVNSDFTLSQENLPHVARICRLVEGLPLGIELAAAWVRMFPCRQIADEIERSLDLLHNPGGNTPERHHSLRATFEYSYNLLSETEQSLFRKLSVFRGGFMPEAARQVVGATPSGLASLLDKSLLQVSPSRRLDLHLTLRQYAAEKLAEVPQEQWETRERHCRTCYLPFVQHREETLRGENPRAALEEIEVELGNVRQAWRWAVAQARIEEIDLSTEGLSRFYDLRGLFREGETAFESAADRMLGLAQNDAKARRAACRSLTAQALFLRRRALYPRVIQVAQAATELAQMTREVLYEARAAFLWGEALWRQGDHKTARTQLERALCLAQTGHDAAERPAPTAREVEANSLNSLAGVCWGQGDYAGVRMYLEQALRIASEAGNCRLKGAILSNLGVVAVEQGEYAEAGSYYQRSLHIDREIGDRGGEGITLTNLGNLCLYLGAYAQAKTYYQQALNSHQEAGARERAGLTMGNLGLLFHYLDENDTALQQTQQALRITQEIGDQSMQAAMWMKLGHALLGLGRLAEAAEAHQNAVALRRELSQSNQAMEPLAGLARVVMAQGNPVQAQAHVEEILSHLETGTLDGTIDPFQIHLSCYRVLEANQDPRAGAILATAYDLLQERAAKITDEEMRRSFLENVASHRETVREYEGGSY